VQPLRLEKRSAYAARTFLEARVAPKGPRAFCFSCPAGGIGIRACLRNTLLRVRIPGGVPASPREQLLRIAPAPLRHSDRVSGTFFYNLGCGQCRHGSTAERDVANVEMRVRLSLPAPTNHARSRTPARRKPSYAHDRGRRRSRRLTARTAAFQAAPLKPQSRFDSGRGRHAHGEAAQATEHSPCKRRVRFDARLLHHLAVAQLASAPRSGRGDRRFESCRRDQYTSVAQRNESARLRAARPKVRVLPEEPTHSDAVTQGQSDRLSSGKPRVRVPPASPPS
jgi:hypothetical protein